jgi:pimeloyl-ACP methyl ester carboxylesterase
MEIIKTKSFQLAVITRGDANAPKLAILTPGRLDTKDYAHNVSHIEFLAGQGYFAVPFDPPGIWDSPGGIELYSTTSCIQAVNELIEYYGNKPTLLMGHSRGGTVSMLAGPTNDKVTHVISVNSAHGGPTTVDRAKVGQITISYRDLPPGTSRTPEAQRKRFDLPYSYFEDGDSYDALDGLADCLKPKLFFYGNRDDLTTPAEVKNMYDTAADPKMIHELSTDHDYRLHAEVIAEVNQVVGEFLSRYSK